MVVVQRNGWTLLLGAIAALAAGCQGPETHPQKPDVPIIKTGEPGSARDVAAPAATSIGPSKSAVDPSLGSNMDRAREVYVKALDCFEQHEYDIALLEFGRCLDVDPTYYKAWFKKGLCFYYKQKYDLEIESYRRCLEIAPAYAPALLNLANALFSFDQLEQAVTYYHKLLDLDPKHPVALYNLGIAYYELGEFQLSVQCLQRYLDAYPGDSQKDKVEQHLRKARQRLDSR